MNQFFNGIKSIGFDLDNTLYQNNPKIDERIRIEIARRVLDFSPQLGNIEHAKNYLEELYRKTGSRTETLRILGFQNPGELVNDCMARANITDLIELDDKAANLIGKLSKKYNLFLITAAVENLALPRIKKIGIDPYFFSRRIFGDTALQHKKIDGSIFKYFLGESPYKSQEHVFIGDSLKGDILPAKSMGMKTIAVGSEFPEADFSVKNIYLLEDLLL